LKKRKATEFPLKMVDVSSVFSSTTCRMIRKSLDSHEKLLAFALPKFAGLLGFELFPGRRLGTEMSDYAKTQGVGGLIHSDEQLAKYPITPEEIAAVCKLTGATSADGWIMIAAPEEKATRAVAAAYSRALIALKGVPEETRKIVKDVESAYMRPLPGGARLYPETDLPPVRVTRKMLSALEMPEMPEEKLARLKKILNDELAVKIFKSPRASTFEKVVASVKGIDATLVASTLEETLIGLKRDGVAVENVSDDAFVELFALSGKFVKAAIPEILKLVASGESVSSAASKFKKMSLKEIESVVAEEKKTTSDKGLLIKRVMERLRLYAEGSEVMKVLKQ